MRFPKIRKVISLILLLLVFLIYFCLYFFDIRLYTLVYDLSLYLTFSTVVQLHPCRLTAGSVYFYQLLLPPSSQSYVSVSKVRILTVWHKAVKSALVPGCVTALNIGSVFLKLFESCMWIMALFICSVVQGTRVPALRRAVWCWVFKPHQWLDLLLLLLKWNKVWGLSFFSPLPLFPLLFWYELWARWCSVKH